MASILDRYGIKEVADVTFCKINADGTRGAPVLYLDTLKVSTIEQTAETSEARGGKGNPKLVSWDYGKEITVSLEDALFSAKSMSLMFGDGTTPNEVSDSVTRTAVMRVTEGTDHFVADMAGENGATRVNVWFGTVPAGQEGVEYDSVKSKIGTLTIYNENSQQIGTIANQSEWPTSEAKVSAGEKVFITYTLAAKSRTINISGDSFPGTYYITGDTYARSDVTGEDQFFQFIIPKAKVTSENTITLEAEGDPSVFNMSLTVLRPDDGIMMKLVQYTLANA